MKTGTGLARGKGMEANMNIEVSQQWVNGRMEFVAVFEGYDGAVDSPTRSQIGVGITADEAKQDLVNLVEA